MSNNRYEHPRDVVVIRFGCNTPYFALSMTYGMLYDPNEKIWFVSLDHYVAYHMLCRPEHRREILGSPNGWIAYQNLGRILGSTNSIDGDPVIHPNWNAERDEVMMRGLRLKFSQNLAICDMLRRTKMRTIVDESRAEEMHWCNARGMGDNRHGTLLEELRAELANGQQLEFRGE